MLFTWGKKKDQQTVKLRRPKLPQLKVICPQCHEGSTWVLPVDCYLEITASFIYGCRCGSRVEISPPYVEERESK